MDPRRPSRADFAQAGVKKGVDLPVSKTIRLGLLWTLLLTAACASSPRPPGDVRHYQDIGTASWYGPDFHGRITANGERYNMFGMTAAHRSLPFDTLVRVTNLENGRRIIVRINDRGPFLKGRILDLSYGAAKELGSTHEGVIRVKIEVVEGTAPNGG